MDSIAEPVRSSDSGDRYRGLLFRGSPAKDRAPLLARPPRSRPIVGERSTEESDAAASPEELAFLEFALARGRQAIGNYRLAPLVRRLPACLRALRVESLDAARQLLEREPSRIEIALDALLIGATSFYRDAAVFDFVRESVLPRLFGSTSRVRILSAACSDGSELYTTAALVDQIERLSDVDLWGIDCRSSAILQAREGSYAEGALSSLPEALRQACLDTDGRRWQVRARLRDATNWAVGNALGASRFGRWNLIFCRNLAIYLRPATTTTLWQNLAHALEPGGYLVVGRAEKPLIPGLFKVGPCTYRKNA